MDAKQQGELLETNREIAAIVSSAANSAAIRAAGAGRGAGLPGSMAGVLMNPAEFYAQAVKQVIGEQCDKDVVDALSHSEVAAAVKMTAAKIRAGDLSFVAESLLGQTLWLQTLAQMLFVLAAKAENKPAHQEMMYRLALRAQSAAGKAVTSLAALTTV